MIKPTLRELFIKYLTQDSATKDARRKEFNQAIFDGKGGWQVCCETDLDMVLEKFDKAMKEWQPLNKVVNELGDDEETIEDGFGNAWSAYCPDCGQKTVSVVRPGKVQCSNCG